MDTCVYGTVLIVFSCLLFLLLTGIVDINIYVQIEETFKHVLLGASCSHISSSIIR